MYFTRRTVAFIVIRSTRTTQWRGIQPGTWVTHTVSLPGHYLEQRHWKQCALSFNMLCWDTIAALIQGSDAKTLFFLLEFSVIFICLSPLTTICAFLTWLSEIFKNIQSITMLWDIQTQKTVKRQTRILQKKKKKKKDEYFFLELILDQMLFLRYSWLAFLSKKHSM